MSVQIEHSSERTLNKKVGVIDNRWKKLINNQQVG